MSLNQRTIDRINRGDVPSERQRRAIESGGSNPRSGGRPTVGTGTPSDPIRRETAQERQTREAQTNLRNLQRELASTGTVLTPAESQAILEGKSAAEVRSQIVQRQRTEDLASLQKELSGTGTRLTEAQRTAILRGDSITSIRENVFSQAQRRQLDNQRREEALEAQRTIAARDAQTNLRNLQRDLASTGTVLTPAESQAILEGKSAAEVRSQIVQRQRTAATMTQEESPVTIERPVGMVRSMQEVREERLSELETGFMDAGFNEPASKFLALQELGREKLDEGKILTSSTPNLGKEIFSRTRDVVASTGADFFFTGTALVSDPKQFIKVLLDTAKKLRTREGAREVLSNVVTEAQRNPLTTALDAAAIGGLARQGVKVGGSIDVPDIGGVMPQGRRAQVNIPSKRTKSKAQIRKESLQQSFDPNINVQGTKVTQKTGRARDSRQSLEVIDPNTIQAVQDRRGRRSGLGTPQDKTTVTISQQQGTRTVDVQREIGFVKGDARTIGGKEFSRPSSQVVTPKGADRTLASLDAGSQKLISEALILQRRQASRTPFNVPKRQPIKKQDPNLINPANIGESSTQALLKASSEVAKQPRATPRGQKPQSRRQARFEALKQTLGKKRRETRQVNVLFEERAPLPPVVQQTGGLFADADNLARLQQAQRDLASSQRALIDSVTEATVFVIPLSASTPIVARTTTPSINVSQETPSATSIKSSPKEALVPAISVSVEGKAEIMPRTSLAPKQDIDSTLNNLPAVRVSNARVRTEPTTVRSDTETPRTPAPKPLQVRVTEQPRPRTNNILQRRIGEPVRPKRPKRLPFPKIPKLKGASNSPLFRVLVGREGNKVFEDLGVGGVDLIKRGRDAVKNTAAATLQIRPVRGGIPQSELKGILGDTFSESKSLEDSFVEDKEERISTAGELRDITFAPRNKKRQGITATNKKTNSALKLIEQGNSLRSIREMLR